MVVRANNQFTDKFLVETNWCGVCLRTHLTCTVLSQEGRVVLAALLPLGRKEEDMQPSEEQEDILKDMPRPQMTYPQA